MSSITSQQLWQQLQEQSLVEGDMPQINASASPWYVRVMLGIAGWIGALFLLGFVGVGFEFVMKSTVAALIVGAACCGAAFAIFRTPRDNDFAMQFGLAVSIAGQGIFIFGLFNAFHSDPVLVYFLVMLFEIALVVMVSNVIHRVLATSGALFALSLALNYLGMSGLEIGIVAAGFAVIWINERQWAERGSLWRPIGYGLTLALLQIQGMRFFDTRWMTGGALDLWGWHGQWIGNAMVDMVFLWAVTRILAHEEIKWSSAVGVAALVAAILIGIVSFPAPGIATALLILLLGFASGNRILRGCGLFGLLGFLSHYYYQLQATLLLKAMVLAATGVTLLLARFVIFNSNVLIKNEGDSNA